MERDMLQLQLTTTRKRPQMIRKLTGTLVSSGHKLTIALYPTTSLFPDKSQKFKSAGCTVTHCSRCYVTATNLAGMKVFAFWTGMNVNLGISQPWRLFAPSSSSLVSAVACAHVACHGKRRELMMLPMSRPDFWQTRPLGEDQERPPPSTHRLLVFNERSYLQTCS